MGVAVSVRPLGCIVVLEAAIVLKPPEIVTMALEVP